MRHSSLCTLSISQRVLRGTLWNLGKGQLVKIGLFLFILSCLVRFGMRVFWLVFCLGFGVLGLFWSPSLSFSLRHYYVCTSIYFPWNYSTLRFDSKSAYLQCGGRRKQKTLLRSVLSHCSSVYHNALLYCTCSTFPPPYQTRLYNPSLLLVRVLHVRYTTMVCIQAISQTSPWLFS